MNEIFYTIPEVAQTLKLSKSKVYYLVQTGKLPHIRIGKNVRIKESDLHRWIDQQSEGISEHFGTGWINHPK